MLFTLGSASSPARGASSWSIATPAPSYRQILVSIFCDCVLALWLLDPGRWGRPRLAAIDAPGV